ARFSGSHVARQVGTSLTSTQLSLAAHMSPPHRSSGGRIKLPESSLVVSSGGNVVISTPVVVVVVLVVPVVPVVVVTFVVVDGTVPVVGSGGSPVVVPLSVTPLPVSSVVPSVAPSVLVGSDALTLV